MFKIDTNKLKLKYIIGCYKDFENYPDRDDLLFDIISYCNEYGVKEIPKKFFEKNYDLNILYLLSDLVKKEILKENKDSYLVINNPFKN